MCITKYSEDVLGYRVGKAPSPPKLLLDILSIIYCFYFVAFCPQVLSHKGGGSGPSYISGWVTAFTCFDKDGKFIGNRLDMRGVHTEFPVIESTDISHNVLSCPVKIDDNGEEYDGTLFTGQVVFEAERGEKDAYPTIRPRNDWCMAVAVK